MAAYVIVDVEVTDPELYEEYKKLSGPSLVPFGGKFLVRGGPSEVLEGEWTPNRIVVLEFESTEKAREWWGSDIYHDAKAIRQRASRGNMILVEGA